MKKFLKNNGAILFFLLLVPGIASANVAVPMFFITVPAMAVALIPIIFIEAKILKKRLGIESNKAYFSSSLANIFTTIIGVPFAWVMSSVTFFLLTSLVAVVGYSSTAADFHQLGGSLFFAINLEPLEFAGITISLIVAFFVSVWLEFRIIQKILKDIDPKKIKKAVFDANIITYGLLIGFSALFLIAPIFF